MFKGIFNGEVGNIYINRRTLLIHVLQWGFSFIETGFHITVVHINGG